MIQMEYPKAFQAGENAVTWFVVGPRYVVSPTYAIAKSLIGSLDRGGPEMYGAS